MILAFPAQWPVPSAMDNWRTGVAESTRGALFTVTNSSGAPLVRRACRLDAGQWTLAPPETIDAGATLQFGAVATGWMSGTEGVLEYSPPGDASATAVVRFCNPLGFWKSDGVLFS